ncbi:hypothetical protein AMTR_s00008p00145610 [Amborella trichopoda]|uniref:MYND-type domain-containing protein n=1 Tax=Amborella trichopoda TaxID=13333 RepID=W1NIP0_AMBTC|nr:hypothetical protein AMTR_s00008p00145610 [Amborella trichopoda]
MGELQSYLLKQGLSVSSISEKGRCLFVGRDFSPGEVIFSQEPYASVLDKGSLSNRCDGCFTSGLNLKRCSSCRMTWYCGGACQRSEWKSHQHECLALVNLSEERRNMLTSSIRLMVRLLLRRRLQNDRVISSNVTDNYNLVQELVAHMSDIDEKKLVLYAQMANLVKLILPNEEIDVKEIVQNFSRLVCNAHTICDSELRPLGTGIYPVMSIINHSCAPNSVLLFEGKLAVIRAMEAIPKGAEVLISYIEIAGSTETRRKALKEQYLFSCTCLRCIKVGSDDDLKESALLEGFRCINDQCDGFLLPNPDGKNFTCQRCGLLRNECKTRKRKEEVGEKLDYASKFVSSGKYSEACNLYRIIDQQQMELYHPLSIGLMRTRETLVMILMELKDCEEALRYCQLTIPVYQRAYPEFHPLLGLQYYTCGKLEWFLEKTLNAVKSLTKAADILKVTHGATTPLVRDLMGLLEEARTETAQYQYTFVRCSMNDTIDVVYICCHRYVFLRTAVSEAHIMSCVIC